jgi:AraC-like DNA-binding protein
MTITEQLLGLANQLTATGKDMSCLDAPKSPHDHGVTLLRVTHSIPREPVLYEPSAVFVLQGAKHGFVGEKSIVYDASRYLVLSVPLPFECETHATPREPMIAIYLQLRREVIAELLTTMGVEREPSSKSPATAEAVPFEDSMKLALLRLLQAKASPVEWAVLGSQLVREVTFRVLAGQQGQGLRALVDSSSHFTSIARVLREIHQSFAEELPVDKLASSAGMSQSVFHQHFREVTATTPVQYIKALRLHRARTLMRHEGLGTGVAALRVGYESRSQFAREFKRFFGYGPAMELARFRTSRSVRNPRAAPAGA